MHLQSPTTWQPLFSAAESAPYLEAIDAVAEAIAHPSPDVFVHSRLYASADVHGRAPCADLASGRAGLALLFAYRHLHTGRDGDRRTSRRLLGESLAAISTTAFSARFFFGWPGVAWAATHLGRLPGWSVDAGPLTEIVRVVEHLAKPCCWAGHLDLVTGLAGLGTYALERLPRPAARQGLAAVVARLDEHAAHVRDTGTWLAPTPGLAPSSEQWDLDQVFRLGLAHGIPGVVALLAEAHAAGIDRARPLLEEVVAWSLEQMPPTGTSGVFRHWSDRGNGNGHGPRAHWSHGAAGLAAALMIAAARTDDPCWRATAIDLAVRAADTPLDRCMITDHTLCQGAAGMAHLYNRMYQATGHEGLREGARTWFRRLLDMRHVHSGIGGFLSYLPRRDRSDPWVADAGLMTGAAGAALAMLAAVGRVEPRWDRLMLVSVPPQAVARTKFSPSSRAGPDHRARSSTPPRPA